MHLRIIEKGEFVEENFILDKNGDQKNEYIYENYRNEYIYLLDSETHESHKKSNSDTKNIINYSEIEEDINLSSMINEEDIIIDSTELNNLKNVNSNNSAGQREKNNQCQKKEKNEIGFYLNDNSSDEKQNLSKNDKDVSYTLSIKTF